VCTGDRIVVSAPNRPGTEAYMVAVPADIGQGGQFHVQVNNQQMMVTCPAGVGAGMKARSTVPSEPQLQAPLQFRAETVKSTLAVDAKSGSGSEKVRNDSQKNQ
jgi:hypothetical protein